MKIQLIYPDISSVHGLPYHPGLASIASVLIDKGHDVKISYFNTIDDAHGMVDQIAITKPDLIGFTTVETQFRYVTYLAAKIKEACKAFIVYGGPYVTLAPDEVLRADASVDALVRGEGEGAIVELAERIESGEEWSDVNNLIFRQKTTGSVIKNPLRPLIEDLDSLPFPNTDLFNYQSIIDHDNMAIFHFNRGCPYRCTFCSNKALGEVYGMAHNRIRYRSVKSVIKEIEVKLLKYRLRDDTLLLFGDDLFIANKKWLAEFCSIYKEKIGRPFWCTGRSNHITDEVCALLKECGCRQMMMSVESGDDYIRNQVMMRNISRETMIRSFELCSKYGINTLATCIIGLPFETPEMVENSIRTVAQLRSVNSYGINIFYPYKGTYLRKVCEEKGFMPKVIADDFVERKGSVLTLPDLPKDLIMYYYKNWVELIMKHKPLEERVAFKIRKHWDGIRKTRLGFKIRALVNNTKIGKRFKRYVMKHVWNRS